MSAVELSPEAPTQTLDDAIIQGGVKEFIENGRYRPDVASYDRMHSIQIVLAEKGIEASLSPIYLRGRVLPLSFALHKPAQATGLVAVAHIIDYR